MTVPPEESNPSQVCKEQGNEAFKEGKWEKAYKCYTDAINLISGESSEKAVCYKNRAAVNLKLNHFTEAVDDCTASLDIVPNDPKALYRRCQALEPLERFEEAYRDARQVNGVDPTNKAIQPILERLHRVVQERLKQNAQMSNKVEQMFTIAFDIAADKEKRETAISNILVLGRESVGADLMIKEGLLGKIGKLVKVEKNKTVFVTCIRIIGELCKSSMERTKRVLQELGVPWFLDMLNSNEEERVNAAQYDMQTVLNSLSGMSNKDDTKPSKELCDQHRNEIDTLLSCLVYSTTSRSITGLARDALIDLLTRNVHYTNLSWAERLVEIRGLQRLMEVAGEVVELRNESAMDVTTSTRTIVAVCLARIYENMYYDTLRQHYYNGVDEYVKERLNTPDDESKVRVVVAITTLLLGPADVGNTIISRPGIMEMILVMAGTEDVLQQKVACECIVAAASKKDKAQSIINQGVHILKKLYASRDDAIRVRALVGLCKLGSSGGTDASIRPFAEGATSKLAEACRKFLVNPAKDKDMRRWAVEGLSYLTLDADVKEKLIEDRPALRAMIELAQSGEQSVVYGVVTTLVNLVNAYEKQEVIPEMMELAKFAKHHIPEDHELDDPDFVSKRLEVLAQEGVTSALVALSKTESPNSKELIARIFNALCGERELRGLVVQHGGAKVLLPMALKGTDKGKKQAAQALARIGITINPEVAFPGQRCLEVIRPLLALLHVECSALENFEALLALCNLAQVGESVRQRILKEGGLAKIETYMFEEHEMLKRASTQVMTNLMMSPDIVKMYEGENDRTKLLVVLCGEDDEETSQAAAGALAMLTSISLIACEKTVDNTIWLESMHRLLGDPSVELQHRGVTIASHLVASSKAVAELVIQSDVMEILLALTLVEGADKEKVRRVAGEALRAAERWELIRKPGQEDMPQIDLE